MNDTAQPGCFWHWGEPLGIDDYRVCLRCGHAFRTRQELLDTARRCRARATTTRPVPMVAPAEAEPQRCPLCAYDW